MIVDAVSTIMDARAQSDDINARIAERVRTLRADRHLSLEALASRCDVSRSMLSLIERGESSPTAVVLEKIATGLGVKLAWLFDDMSQPASPVARGAQRTSWKDPQSGYVRRNISPAFPSPIRIVEVEFPAGAKVAYESGASAANGSPATAQQIWVLDGAIEVTVGDVTHELGKGDCLAMKLDAPVTFRNRTRRKAHYVVVLAS